MDTTANGLGHTARSLRIRMGLTQQALADLSGVHVSTIAAIDAGGQGVSLRVIGKVAPHLGVTSAELVAACEQQRAVDAEGAA